MIERVVFGPRGRELEHLHSEHKIGENACFSPLLAVFLRYFVAFSPLFKFSSFFWQQSGQKAQIISHHSFRKKSTVFYENLSKMLSELTEDELKQVIGGMDNEHLNFLDKIWENPDGRTIWISTTSIPGVHTEES